MACFLVPAAEAIVTAIATKVTRSKEKESETVKISLDNGSLETATKIPFSKKLKWLTNLLCGGSALLAFEHVWHGEVVSYFPFLTAASNPKDASVMLNETATTGVSMALLVTLVWVGMLIVSSVIEKRTLRASVTAKEGI